MTQIILHSNRQERLSMHYDPSKRAGSVMSKLYKREDDNKIVKMEKVKQQNIWRLTIALTMFSIIPIQMVLSSYAREFENSIILSYQKTNDTAQYPILRKMVRMYNDATKCWVVECILLFCFLFFDSILTFKTIMVWSFTIYAVMIIKLLMQEPRPYWTEKTV